MFLRIKTFFFRSSFELQEKFWFLSSEKVHYRIRTNSILPISEICSCAFPNSEPLESLIADYLKLATLQNYIPGKHSNPVLATLLFLYSLETSENQKLYDQHQFTSRLESLESLNQNS